MKYTIEGFSQEVARSFKKTIGEGANEKVIKIDCTDLVILRWFVDFYPNMRKMNIDGREYAWLTHKKLIEDLPILDITKRSCIERMQKLVEFEILEYTCVKEGGTFSLYTFGKNYQKLVSTDDTQSNNNGMQPNVGGTQSNVDGMQSNVYGMQSNNTGGIRSTDIGVYGQLHNKDNSIIDISINNNKKESKKKSFDEIIENYTQDLEIRDLLKEWLKVRKAKRSAMTNRAIEMNLAKLEELAQKSQKTIKEYLSEVICRGWAAFYEIKTYTAPPAATPTSPGYRPYHAEPQEWGIE